MVSLSLEDLKQRNKATVCPTCSGELEEFAFKESGEEFYTQKCSKCSWWGNS